MDNNQDEIEKLYFTIGEVAEELKLSPSLIRFWEKEFSELSPRKTSKGTRKYSKEDKETIKLIYQLVKVEGHTLSGAKEKLKIKNKLADKSAITDKLLNLKQFLSELKEQLD
ncbi:MAG: MerR family transcriptional regulator [Bacteroidia bacterium]